MALEVQDEMLTTRQVQEELRLGKTTLWALLQAGELPYHRMGDRVIRISRTDLEEYKTRTRRGGKPAGQEFGQ